MTSDSGSVLTNLIEYKRHSWGSPEKNHRNAIFMNNLIECVCIQRNSCTNKQEGYDMEVLGYQAEE